MEISARRCLERAKRIVVNGTMNPKDALLDSIYMYGIREDEVEEILERFNKILTTKIEMWEIEKYI